MLLKKYIYYVSTEYLLHKFYVKITYYFFLLKFSILQFFTGLILFYIMLGVNRNQQKYSEILYSGNFEVTVEEK